MVTGEPSRLLVAGDVHGDLPHMRYLIDEARGAGCDGVLQLGDLNYEPRTPSGQFFLAETCKRLARAKLDLWFIEGNHDDLGALTGFNGPRRIAAPSRGAHGGVTYLPRGSRWSWQGVRFLAVGGGFSIDRGQGREGSSWFASEIVSDAELAAILADRSPVDVCVFHDAPSGAQHNMPLLSAPESLRQQDALRLIVDTVKPKLVLHGHLHRAYTAEIALTDGSWVACRGLESNESAEASWFVLDLAEL